MMDDTDWHKAEVFCLVYMMAEVHDGMIKVFQTFMDTMKLGTQPTLQERQRLNQKTITYAKDDGEKSNETSIQTS